MSDLDAFHGPNAGYVLDLYDRYLESADSVGPEWRDYFERFPPAVPSTNGAATYRAAPDGIAAAPVEKIVGAAALVDAIREYGHLAARIDPLGFPLPGAPDLDPETHGITDSDLSSLSPVVVGGPCATGASSAKEAVANLREVYSGSAGFRFRPRASSRRTPLADFRSRVPAILPGNGTFGETGALAPVDRRRGIREVPAPDLPRPETLLDRGNDMLVPMLDEIVHNAAARGGAGNYHGDGSPWPPERHDPCPGQAL